MNNKILISLITFLVIAIIVVAGALVYITHNNSESNITTSQNSLPIEESEEVAQNTETQSQNIITENTTIENVVTENAIAQNNVTTENTITDNTANNNKKILIAFFSRADENYVSGTIRYIDKGNTEVIAEYIRDIVGADMFKGARASACASV